MNEKNFEYVADGQDWVNHIAHFGSSNAVIQLVVEFDSQIDFELMKKAVRYTIELEPILGCYFEEDPVKPLWKSLMGLDTIEWCTLEEVDDAQKALETFASEPMVEDARQLEVKVIRSADKELLAIKLNHSSMDGGGVKAYLSLVAQCYSKLYKGEFISLVPISDGIRNSNCIFQALEIKDPKVAYNPQRAALKPSWGFPFKPVGTDRIQHTLLKVQEAAYFELKKYGFEKKATFNDLILTAYFRALFSMLQPVTSEQMDINISIDLRRYLKDEGKVSICNLSGVEPIRINRIIDEPFVETLHRVKGIIDNLKKERPGLHSAASMLLMMGMGYQRALGFFSQALKSTIDNGKSSPLLSNMGVIADGPLLFGSRAVKDVYIITPAFQGPSTMLGVSTYNNRMTFVMSFFEDQENAHLVDQFIILFRDELLSILQ